MHVQRTPISEYPERAGSSLAGYPVHPEPIRDTPADRLIEGNRVAEWSERTGAVRHRPLEGRMPARPPAATLDPWSALHRRVSSPQFSRRSVRITHVMILGGIGGGRTEGATFPYPRGETPVRFPQSQLASIRGERRGAEPGMCNRPRAE